MALLDRLGEGAVAREIGVLSHAYSHFKLLTTLYAATLFDARAGDPEGFSWCPVSDLASVPLHGAHRKALDLFLLKNNDEFTEG